ncbi:DUF1284 domain-containing protein (plasmid) [Rhizobium sp. TRM96647]|uniref:DUF1284 domain-containing protein n=1 Tax=unclassified Rhizobium TaxID=2613769 RepID=UPI0021E98E6A|nr:MULTISPECIES: DUF1284 domain-containing protein [unclassified Rhizobium]MCV3735524.1 DUF1284 domain-containing protein [Rhizobium sp. TRM96647]MCV3757713.1 DUF1284 domain-containing protein [Rhizobium sp. TRM96650]
MTVRLRAHHLLCMLTFVGKGYSPAFVDNYRAIARRLSAGETILVVEGPDDICAPLMDGDTHCRDESVAGRDRQAAEAVSVLTGRAVAAGTTILPDEALLERLRSAFAGGDLRTACGGCEWGDLCSRVSAHGFPGVLVGRAPATGEGS